MNIPKRHHYLPQFYLKNFTNNDGLFWVFDRKNKEYRQQHPVNTALQKDYYTFRDKNGKKHTEIEKLFSSIEGKIKPVINKIDMGNTITSEEKVILSFFISFQKTRVPDFEKSVNELSGKMLTAIIQKSSSKDDIVSFIKEYKKNTGKKVKMSPEDLLDFIQSNEFSIDFEREWSLPMILRLGVEFSQHFVNMNWIFLWAPKNSSFITSDNPFVLVPPSNYDLKSLYGVGLITPGAKKLIPLSQRTCLMITDYGHSISNKEIDSLTVKKINLNIAIRSDRFLIAKDKPLLKKIVEITKVNEWKKKESVRVS